MIIIKTSTILGLKILDHLIKKEGHVTELQKIAIINKMNKGLSE